MGRWTIDLATGLVTADRFVCDLLGLDPDRQVWSRAEVEDRVHPDDLPGFAAMLDRTATNDAHREVFLRDRRRDPVTDELGARWIGFRGGVVGQGQDGAPPVLAGVVWDGTEQARLRQARAVLTGEMDHRVKNAYAVIGSLVNLGARRACDVPGFAADLSRQIAALAEAHDVSTRLAARDEVGGVLAPAAGILTEILTPWRAMAPRILADETILLEPKRAAAFAMLLHELATNAAKYGALGEAGGTLSITLFRQPDGGPCMTWIERRMERAPAGDADAPGYGSILMHHCLTVLGARAERDMRPEGLHLVLRMAPPRAE
ncbi:MAG: sensor histidine kinase [Pseudomonadota bacterium]